MAYVSPQSNSLVEQKRLEFVKNFKAVIISDTVKKIIGSSIPINEENGKSELIDDNHIEELNNLISKSAKDLTDEAIKGKMIKTNFGENEVPSNFLDAVAQSAESFVENESIQRANWFKLQIQNDKISDAEKDYNNFDTKLKLTFQKLNFSVEEFKQMFEEQAAIAKSFEEEAIIDSIRDTVIDEINESQTRQNKIVEIMQEVQDTKKEYETELEETTDPNQDDIETAPISDPETENTEETPATPESEGNSTENVVMGKKKPSDADKLANKMSKEDTNLNENETKSQDTPAEKANSKEGVGAMATSQNIDNFPSRSNEIGVGNGGYSGPSVDELGTGVLDADESNLVSDPENKESTETETNTQTESMENKKSVENLDGEQITNPKPVEDQTGETVSQVPNFDADAENSNITKNENGETVEYTENAKDVEATIKVDPVLGAEAGEIKKDATTEDVEKTVEALALKFMPISLIKLEVNNIYSKEDLTKVLVKLGNHRKRLIDKLNFRIGQVEDLISSESADTTKVSEKLNQFKTNFKASIDNAQQMDFLFAKVGLDANSVFSKESLFGLSIAKNILNRSSRRKDKNKKFARILDEKDYAKSVENLVDYMFAMTSLKRNLDKSNNIQASLEEVAQHEERINGAIYALNNDDKERANALKNLLGIKNIDHYFVYDNLLLDFNNNLTRVSEDQEETPINVISSNVFVNKVLDKLENKGFERTASLENMVVHIVKEDFDPSLISPNLYDKICMTYGKKLLQMSKEGMENDIENSKIGTKAKVLLTIRRTAEALNIANQEFIDSFDRMFSYSQIA